MMYKTRLTLGVGWLLIAGVASAQQDAGRDQAGAEAAPPPASQSAAPQNGAPQSGVPAEKEPQANAPGSAKPIDREDLLEIYQRAVQNDPAIREAEATYLAQAQNRPLARSKLLPQLSLDASTSYIESSDPNGLTDYQTGKRIPGINSVDQTRDTDSWSVSISQTVFDWSRIVGLKQADKQVAQAETKYESAKQDLMVRVAGAYFGVLGAQDSLEAAIAAREALSQQLEQQKQRFQVGLIAVTDVQETQAGYDSAVAEVIAAQQALALAQEQLREIIGESVSDLAGPTGNLPLQTPNPNSADAWVETALKQNPQLIAQRIAADIAQDDITIARAARLPTLSLSTGYTDSSNTGTRTLSGSLPGLGTSHSLTGSQGYNWSLDLRVPLFSGGQMSSTIQQRVYTHRAQLEESERVARQTERQTRDAYLGVTTSIASVRALEQAQKSAETSLQATEAGFQVGTRTSVDVVNSQQNLRKAQTDYAKARYDYIVNTLKLKQAAGNLAMGDMQRVNGWLGP